MVLRGSLKLKCPQMFAESLLNSLNSIRGVFFRLTLKLLSSGEVEYACNGEGGGGGVVNLGEQFPVQNPLSGRRLLLRIMTYYLPVHWTVEGETETETPTSANQPVAMSSAVQNNMMIILIKSSSC